MEFDIHKSRELVADPHELDGNRVCGHVCNPASVMEFCLKREVTHPLLSCETATETFFERCKGKLANLVIMGNIFSTEGTTVYSDPMTKYGQSMLV